VKIYFKIKNFANACSPTSLEEIILLKSRRAIIYLSKLTLIELCLIYIISSLFFAAQKTGVCMTNTAKLLLNDNTTPTELPIYDGTISLSKEFFT
jgi:hypothetical protein